MVYLERIPAAPLNKFIRMLWHVRVNDAPHRRERVLPGGSVEVLLNLAHDYLLDCPEGESDRRMPPTLIVGARSIYEIIDTSDLADMVGIAFAPAGFAWFVSDAVDLFSNRTIRLEDVWGSQVNVLRDRLREMRTSEEKLGCLEQFLRARFVRRLSEPAKDRTREVAFALGQFDASPGAATVREVARQTGWSERRFSQIFREEVGLSPKVWCRVQRFQRAVQQLYAGRDVRWAELAIECGYYDQSHFANEFRAFSGIDASTYSAHHRGPWANHLPAE